MSQIIESGSPVALLVGHPDQPYGSAYLIILELRSKDAIYFIPCSLNMDMDAFNLSNGSMHEARDPRSEHSHYSHVSS